MGTKKGPLYDIKIINKAKITKKQIKTEVHTLVKQKNSKKVIRMYVYFIIEEFLYLILDYYEGGNLANYLLKKKTKQLTL